MQRPNANITIDKRSSVKCAARDPDVSNEHSNLGLLQIMKKLSKLEEDNIELFRRLDNMTSAKDKINPLFVTRTDTDGKGRIKF